ncbi:E1-like protein-activating [Ephemerocybe angulata]|uniref:Ubiquitin-like modifier-activating enzyme ATG7 n=1 Tax=Ephemerocybe angulata TaxID=980116 RepID=A0A8H6HXN4_9AGAR|nr:E1-like protein-activating [Tulosesus angulatus]
MPTLQFAPFSSVVSPAFWHKLTDLKIDVLKLSDEAVPITGTYTAGKSIVDRETGQEVHLGTGFSVGGESFEASSTTSTTPGASGHSGNAVTATGSFKNFNTIEEFKALDKTKYFDEEAQKIWDSIIATKSTAELNRFFVITFADLKKYKYYYWFSFPAFVSKPAWEIGEGSESWKSVVDVLSRDELASINAQLRAEPTLPAFFLVKRARGGSQGAPVIGKVEDYETFFTDVPTSERIVSFIDPSPDPQNPGWPLRNLLAYLRALYPESTTSMSVLRWRDTEVTTPTPNTVWKSQIGTVYLKEVEGAAAGKRPSAVGWERNPNGKLGARLADLAPMMDPTRTRCSGCRSQLEADELDLEKVSGTKCLLLGAGTLGCYVARALMGWGVRTITLLDSSRVSFSNPVRQPLFEFEDCVDGGKPKAECASERLRKIFPGVNATGHTLSIPMPGHPVPAGSVEQVRKDVEKLEALIDEHDVIFQLMDSRESRWVPTVLGAAKGKIVINAALGFDTFLVMRHGVRARDQKEGQERLGCYYCNDIVAPGDSLTDRTLDQMCTVTRPGLAPIASATAVELLTSLLQHPEGPETGGSVLGAVPHQIRGFLAQFRNLQLIGRGWDRCTGCSEGVLEAYEKDGFDMLLKVFNDQKYLEEIAGLG